MLIEQCYDVEEFIPNIRTHLEETKRKWDSRSKGMSLDDKKAMFHEIAEYSTEPINCFLMAANNNAYFRFKDVIMGYIEDGRYTLDEAERYIKKHVIQDALLHEKDMLKARYESISKRISSVNKLIGEE